MTGSVKTLSDAIRVWLAWFQIKRKEMIFKRHLSRMWRIKTRRTNLISAERRRRDFDRENDEWNGF